MYLPRIHPQTVQLLFTCPIGKFSISGYSIHFVFLESSLLEFPYLLQSELVALSPAYCPAVNLMVSLHCHLGTLFGPSYIGALISWILSQFASLF